MKRRRRPRRSVPSPREIEEDLAALKEPSGSQAVAVENGAAAGPQGEAAAEPDDMPSEPAVAKSDSTPFSPSPIVPQENATEGEVVAAAPVPLPAIAGEPHADPKPKPRDFPLPEKREKKHQAVVRRSVLNEVHAHAHATNDIEICGVLLGELCSDDSGTFLHVTGSLRASSTTNHSSQVTFTAEAWTEMADAQERDHPEKRIVGWYHSHPGHGIFLSGMDLFIQQHFFDLWWQVALVCDPQRREDGIFIWRDGQTVRDDLLIEEDEPEKEPPSGTADSLEPLTIEELADRVRTLENRQKWLVAVIVLLAIGLVVWPLVLPMVMEKRPDWQITPSPSTQPAAGGEGPSASPADGSGRK